MRNERIIAIRKAGELFKLLLSNQDHMTTDDIRQIVFELSDAVKYGEKFDAVRFE